jgi:hypothetical protein
MLTSDANGTTVFVRPIEMEGASDDKPKVSFRKVGEQHFLSAIQTADYVYNFSVSRSVTAGHNIFWNAASTLFGASGCLLREPLGKRPRLSLRF